MRWLPSISFSSSSTGSSSSSSAKSSPARGSLGGEDGAGVRVWRFGSRGKATAARQRKQLRHFSDREIVVSASGIPRLSDGHVSYRCASGYDNLPARLAVPQPLPLPEFSPDFRRRDCSASGSGGSGNSPLRSPKSNRAADVADDNSAASGGIQSIFSIRETGASAAADPVPKGRPSHGGFHKFRVEVPTRSLPASPFESPARSPQRPGYDLVPYYLYMVPKGNQIWSAPEMATADMVPGMPPPAFLDCSPFSNDCSPVSSPPGRTIRQFCRSPNESPSPFPARVSLEIASSRHEGTAEVHPLPLPPGASPMHSPSSPVTQAVAKSEPVLMKSQWQKGKLIGRGTFGSVYVASNRETGALCAMKEVELLPDDPKSAECIKQLQQEINVLSQLKHQNIVQYYGSEIIKDRFYIYLEYVHPGSINKYARDHYGAITESVIRNFTRHILLGLAYLHSTKTIHRDIKGANLLVDSTGVVKLADFGMAKHLTGQAADLSLKGSPYWMAPELMQAVMQKDNSSELALAVDIWSLGCTIIEMLTGKPPWGEYEGAAAMFKVMKDSPPIPETLSSEGKHFLQCCFRRNPAERPSAAMLLEHRFLKNLPPLEVSTQAFSAMNLTDKSSSPTTDRPVHSPKSPTMSTFQGKFACEM